MVVQTLQGNCKTLRGNTRAMATVTALIDGTGSIGQSETMFIELKCIFGRAILWV